MTKWKEVAETLESSYKQNGYGQVLYDIVIQNDIRRVFEIGCYQGYSTIYIAAALQAKNDLESELEVYDAWDWYKYRHCKQEDTVANLLAAGLGQMVLFYQLFALDVQKRLRGSYDMAHIDISNTGETFGWAAKWLKKYIRKGGFLVMEGGSKERDRVEWMVKYEKPPIRPLIEQGFDGWDVKVKEAYPSMTIMRRV